MGHRVTGFIVSLDRAPTMCAQQPLLRFVALSQDFAIFPLTDDLLDTMLPSSQSEGFTEFTYLSHELASLLLQLSRIGPLLYFETDYHGGAGEQSVILLEQARVIFGPAKAPIGPINDGLRRLGVKTRPGDRDEFDAVGLGRYRDSGEWLESRN
jgi:hypothetical protein